MWYQSRLILISRIRTRISQKAKVLEDHGFSGSRLTVEKKKVEPVIIYPNVAVVIRPGGPQEGVGLAGMRVLVCIYS
ncbi:hypothetical protein Tco_0931850 [Tanacetum coccineum]